MNQFTCALCLSAYAAPLTESVALATSRWRQVMDAWWSEATNLQFASQNGGAYVGGPFRGVIHTTEIKSYTPSTTSYYGHHNPPHFTLAMERDEAKLYQHFPINVAARALEHNAGTVETNRRSAIQIELAWNAADIVNLPEAMLEKLWDWMRWVESQTGVRSWEVAKFVGEGDGKGLNSSSRMSDDDWAAFNGWCGHQHVPGNRHWDPGKLDIGRLLRIKRPGTPARCEVAGWFGVNAM